MREFIQTGPTCGFYCLEYAMAVEEGRDPSAKNVREMLEAALAEGRTAVGELFTADGVEAAFRSMYGGSGTISRRRLDGKRRLKLAIQEEGVVVLPAMSRRNIPHYYAVLSRDGDDAKIYDPGDPSHSRMTVGALMRANAGLKSEFDWGDYFRKRRRLGLYYFLKDHARSPAVMGPAAQRARRHGRREYEAGRLGGKGEVDTRGVFFVVKAAKPGAEGAP